MIIKLVSFPCWRWLSPKQREKRINAVTDILNKEDSDFVLFSEWIFNREEDLIKVNQSVCNKKTTALFELKPGKDSSDSNILFLLQNGNIIKLNTEQIFIKSKEVTERKVELLIDELEQHRTFQVDGKRFLIILCGENNILKTVKGEKDAVFRIPNKNLRMRFESILSNIDVILNPTHSRWKRFHDLTCRLSKFSEKNRYCFYCTQLDGNMLKNANKNTDKNTAQRAMKSRRILKPINPDKSNQDYLVRVYKI